MPLDTVPWRTDYPAPISRRHPSTRRPDDSVPGWLIAFGTFAFGLAIWAFVELALVMMTDLTRPLV